MSKNLNKIIQNYWDQFYLELHGLRLQFKKRADKVFITRSLSNYLIKFRDLDEINARFVANMYLIDNWDNWDKKVNFK